VKFTLRLASIGLVVCGFCFSAETTPTEAGRKQEEVSCVPCHSLRLVDSQRLSTAAWTKEVDKMIGWGAVVPDRQVLIDYLSANYSDSKPIPTPARSGDGTASAQHK
jgi:hypothetical protein